MHVKLRRNFVSSKNSPITATQRSVSQLGQSNLDPPGSTEEPGAKHRSVRSHAETAPHIFRAACLHSRDHCLRSTSTKLHHIVQEKTPIGPPVAAFYAPPVGLKHPESDQGVKKDDSSQSHHLCDDYGNRVMRR